ncbi:MAG: NAD(P)-dependent oxidoreductase [Eubacteriales bacterium]|nr:NAD(P)-dependent oxidoreductase [Eubacteriales bacterium]
MKTWKLAVLMPENEIRNTFFSKELCQDLNQLGEVHWNPKKEHYTEEELKVVLQNKDVAITGWGCLPLSEEVLKTAKDLKVLAHTGGSVSVVAPQEVFEKGITVLSGNEIYAASTAEGALAYILMGLRRLPDFMTEMTENGWRKDDYQNQGLLERDVGIVGFGAVAKNLIQLLQPFRVNIKVCSNHATEEELRKVGAKKVDLEEVFECGIVSLHGAGGSGISIGKELLQRLPDGAVLVNSARGDLIKEEELAKVLKSRPSLLAVLDVFAVEPLPMGSELRQLSNVYRIPHMAGPTIDRRTIVTRKLIQDLRLIQEGKPAKLEIKAERAKFMTK